MQNTHYGKINLQMNEKPKSKIKLYFFIFIVLLTISAGGFVYFKYNEFIKLQSSANAAIRENEILKSEKDEYNQLKNGLENEKVRCEQLLLKEEGNFAEFTYCQKYIEFLDNKLGK